MDEIAREYLLIGLSHSASCRKARCRAARPRSASRGATAAAYLEAAGRPVPFAGLAALRRCLAVNAPLLVGHGAAVRCRRRDARRARAGELRGPGGDRARAAGRRRAAAAPYACACRDGVIAGADLIAAVHDDLAAGRPRGRRSPPRSTRASPPAAAAACATRRPSRARSCSRAGRSRTCACSRRPGAGSRSAASGCSATRASRPTTAGSATGRRPRPPSSRDVDVGATHAAAEIADCRHARSAE